MHESYHTEGKTDDKVILEQAAYRLKKGWPQPEETLVHLHGADVYCNVDPAVRNEEDKQHVWFLLSDLEPPKAEVIEVPTVEVVGPVYVDPDSKMLRWNNEA